ncbi:hypothetical protein FKW77_009574 [Venturia effusa]|uniref:Uncharacterized protein n=1 Tax=Venturia effusa TaxID=50376 RepID=A0A517LA07_9PEZI|nr:hypothetical protein FKW77_009574 [Venturia effusa]
MVSLVKIREEDGEEFHSGSRRESSPPLTGQKESRTSQKERPTSNWGPRGSAITRRSELVPTTALRWSNLDETEIVNALFSSSPLPSSPGNGWMVNTLRGGYGSEDEDVDSDCYDADRSEADLFHTELSRNTWMCMGKGTSKVVRKRDLESACARLSTPPRSTQPNPVSTVFSSARNRISQQFSNIPTERFV